MVEQQIDKDFKHLVRIANTDLDGRKQIASALRKIKGVGFQIANAVCVIANVDKNKVSGYLSDEDIQKMDGIIKDISKNGAPDWILNRRKDTETNNKMHIITSELDFTQDNDIKMMKKIKSYRGMRHAFGLPVRGQRTKSNFRKNKGKVQGVKRKSGSKAGKV